MPRFDPVLEGNEKTIVLDLFYSRDKNKEKIVRQDVQYVFVMENGHGSLGFFIKSNAGHVIDFSYLKCFNELSPKTVFSNACRAAILPDKPYCKPGYERHHAGKSMSQIINMFIEQKHIDLSKVNYSGKEFKDTGLVSAFRIFHNKHARFKIVTKEQHKAIHQNCGE